MYFFHSHNEHNKFLDIFDDANVLECYRRTESIVPQQALALWNSKLALTMAGEDQRRAPRAVEGRGRPDVRHGGVRDDPGTTPTHDELAACLEALAEFRAALKDVKEPERTKRARLQVVQALLNHNDFVTVR